MTIVQVKRKGENGARAGTQALTLLAIPINVHVLQALADGPKSLLDLRREAGSPPQTTMRGYLRTLNETGVVTRRRQNGFPASLHYELAGPGRELLAVTGALQTWLAAAPGGPLQPGSTAAKGAVMALVEGWGTNMMRALAARPLSLTELDGVITGVSYPSLERRLAAMRLAGQLKKMPGRGRGTPYIATEWLRGAIGPLFAAARWERRHLQGEAAPIVHRDVEAAFLLTMPLLQLPLDTNGSCRMAVELRDGGRDGLAGVMVRVEEGRVTSCTSRLEGDPDAWAVGPPMAWLSTVIEHDIGCLELGGDRHLVSGLIKELHERCSGLRKVN